MPEIRSSNLAPPRHFLLRLTRLGPLVPARLRWLDHAPEDPAWNKLDRWPVYVLCADIAGVDVPPEDITERAHIKLGHWKWPQPITEAEYRYRMARLRWAEGARPDDPTLAPRRAVDPEQIEMPSFGKENGL